MRSLRTPSKGAQGNLFEDWKETVRKFFTSRLTILAGVMVLCALLLIWRLFDLQLVRGREYMDSFQLMIRKERIIPGVRGNIYDRNGNILAYNELTYSVTIEDVFDNGRGWNRNLNRSVNLMVEILERNSERIILNFPIALDDNGMFVFTLEGNRHLRFLADVYGYPLIDEMPYRERIKTAQEVVDDLAERFGIGDYADPENSASFVPGLGYTPERMLTVMTIRYAMSLTGYQKYLETTVAEGVSDRTIADIRENGADMPGVNVAESTTRRYVDPQYFSPIIGYVGRVSQEELDILSAEDATYNLNDIIGKAGIEQSMEGALAGEKGSEIIFVDKMGKVIEVGEHNDPLAGNDVYLTIDKDLQMAAYDLLESRIAGIILQRLRNSRSYPQNVERTNDLTIPIYDVYYALFRNAVIDITHFTKPDAGPTELKVQSAFAAKLEDVLTRLDNELRYNETPYDRLTLEFQVYQTMITTMLYNNDIIDSDLVDRSDPTYIAWTTEETISLTEFLRYCIAQNWVDVTLLGLEAPYSDAEEVFDAMVNYTITQLSASSEFQRRLYRYLIDDDIVTGRDVCNLLIEQGAIHMSQEALDNWLAGVVEPYAFLRDRITNLELTPAQLALDPCSGSIVITDVNTGDVLALVSYPGYDNNQIQNTRYFARLNNDLSRPLYNYATQQRTAPGSTFKMVAATAGLMHNAITTSSTFVCHGEFDKVTPSPRCWIYPGGHGTLALPQAIRHSCNVFFFNVGYNLSAQGPVYSDDTGLACLREAAELYGLTTTTGIEITEAEPQVSTNDAVRSSIGQGNVGYTAIGMARYVTTLANRGTCFNLTLIDRLTDREGNLLYENEATVRNRVEMPAYYWDAIHLGMRGVVQNQAYWEEVSVNAAGKTGTAEEVRTRGDHALFIGFAPYENPEISVTVRVAFGYNSGYTSQIAKDMFRYYFNPEDRDEVLAGTARELTNVIIND